MFAFLSGDVPTMRTFAEESFQVAGRLGDARATVWPLIFLGIGASEVGEYPDAEIRYNEAIARAHKAGDLKLAGTAINNLGSSRSCEGTWSERYRSSKGPSRFRETSEHRTRSRSRPSTSRTASIESGGERSRGCGQGGPRAGARHRESHLSRGRLVLLGALAARQGDADLGARLLGAAEVLRDRSGQAEQAVGAEFIESMASELYSTLGAEKYATALAAGKAIARGRRCPVRSPP